MANKIEGMYAKLLLMLYRHQNTTEEAVTKATASTNRCPACRNVLVQESWSNALETREGFCYDVLLEYCPCCGKVNRSSVKQ